MLLSFYILSFYYRSKFKYIPIMMTYHGIFLGVYKVTLVSVFFREPIGNDHFQLFYFFDTVLTSEPFRFQMFVVSKGVFRRISIQASKMQIRSTTFSSQCLSIRYNLSFYSKRRRGLEACNYSKADATWYSGFA